MNILPTSKILRAAIAGIFVAAAAATPAVAAPAAPMWVTTEVNDIAIGSKATSTYKSINNKHSAEYRWEYTKDQWWQKGGRRWTTHDKTTKTIYTPGLAYGGYMRSCVRLVDAKTSEKSAWRCSPATDRVGYRFDAAPKLKMISEPTLTGNAEWGGTLTASPGSWEDQELTTTWYTWWAVEKNGRIVNLDSFQPMLARSHNGGPSITFRNDGMYREFWSDVVKIRVHVHTTNDFFGSWIIKDIPFKHDPNNPGTLPAEAPSNNGDPGSIELS